jgi:hypothetical protein
MIKFGNWQFRHKRLLKCAISMSLSPFVYTIFYYFSYRLIVESIQEGWTLTWNNVLGMSFVLCTVWYPFKYMLSPGHMKDNTFSIHKE